MALSPEQLARIEAGVGTEEDLLAQAAESTHEDAPIVTEQVEDVADEVEDLSEQLALQSIITDEKLQEVLECLERLEQSSKTESPSLAAIQAELLNLRTELVNLKSSMATSHTNRTQNQSPERQPEELPNPVNQTEEPELSVTPEPVRRKKSRFI